MKYSHAIEWPAEEYAIGSYIQSTISDLYLPSAAEGW